jgi:hypothetical protein
MAITAYFRVPGMHPPQYEQIIAGLEAAGLGAPDGRLYHVASLADDGMHVLDVWDSEEKLGRFAERLIPIIISTGVTPPQPEVGPAHKVIANAPDRLPATGAVTTVIVVPGMTAAQYDQIGGALDAQGLSAPEGRRYHVAGPTDGGWLLFGVWDSEEAFGRFGERVRPLSASAGFALPPPEVRPVHNVIVGQPQPAFAS